MHLCLPQELEQMKSRIARDEVNVEVDSGPSGPELGSILSDLRSQYEDIVKKNKDQAEQWYRRKVGGRRPPSLCHSQKKIHLMNPWRLVFDMYKTIRQTNTFAGKN